ncbi:UNVERIFIED_CONTAM: F-box protein [Sesamum angustifolium]|uniref:F-box protein n=1 Tax=Sesamum angustifolium TaxID=2727405 RepID=A0AAW2LHW1_9LAMI
MDGSMDFIQWVGEDMSLKILMCLEDPSDLVRTGAVSSSWRQFVITHGLCKNLCLRMFPEASSFTRVIECDHMGKSVATGTDDSAEWTSLVTEHKVYALLSRGLTTSTREKNCMSDSIFASSTDNYPEESIKNTLEQSDRVNNRATYWSSKEYPMAQENRLQKFKLPEPVLCIGGILKVELLGRVQTQEMDGLYYICINHVAAIGRPLSPLFDVKMIDEQGKCTLTYNPCTFSLKRVELIKEESSSQSHFRRFSESIRTWEQVIISTLRGAGPLMIDDNDSDHEDLD